MALALLDLFGQHPSTSRASSGFATLEVQSPHTLRGGLIFQTRITVHARTAMAHPTLVLEHGWFESMSVNSMVPDPVGQTAVDGDVHLTFPRLASGQTSTFWVYFQVNPTNIGRAFRERRSRRGARPAPGRPPHSDRAALMDLVIRTLVVISVVFVLTRLVGRRELSSLEPFDLILLVVVGDLIQQGITQSDDSVTGATIVLATLALMTVGLSYLSFRVPRLRPLLEGEPIVLVIDGKTIEANLRRERITMDDLLEEARQQQLDSLENVRFAVLETSGRISFLVQS